MTKTAVTEVLDNGALSPAVERPLYPDGATPITHMPGIQLSAQPLQPIDISVFLGPVRWTRWRLAVRRLGPYAPAYDGRSVQLQPNVLRLGFAICVLVVLTAVVAGHT